jgi:hypothetical protein
MVAPIKESINKMSQNLIERILKREGKYHPELGAEYYPIYDDYKYEIEAYAVASLNGDKNYGIYWAPHTLRAHHYCEIIGGNQSPGTSVLNNQCKGIVEINKYLVDLSRSSEGRKIFLPMLELTIAHEIDHHKFTMETMGQFYDLGNRIASTLNDIDYLSKKELLKDFFEKYHEYLYKIYDEIEYIMELSAFAVEMYNLLDWSRWKRYNMNHILYILVENVIYAAIYNPACTLVVYDLFGGFDPTHWMWRKILKLIKDPYEFSKDKDSIEEMMNYLEKKRERLYNSCARKVKYKSRKLSEEFDKLKEEIFRK